MEASYKIELKDISKSFPGVLALDNVSIRVKRGAVHAIMGENGAGKSTLMKVIDGLHQPDKGSIHIDGKPVKITNPIEARENGIAMIFQELNYFPDLSVEENIFMGRFPSKGAFVDWKNVRRRVVELCREQNIDYDPKTKIKNLSVSEIQMLEIIKAVSFQATIIIMDEPTSAISTKEVEQLFKKIEELKANGISILYISHKMDEIFRIADDITVMRDGKVIVSGPASDFTEESLITAMVGRKMENIYPKEKIELGEDVLVVKDLYEPGVFEKINLHVRKGEIVGIAGLVGAGRTELARALFGMDPYTSGEILIRGEPVKINSIEKAVRNGIIMLSEDRKEYGIVPIRSIRENITLSHFKFTRGLFVNSKKEKEMSAESKEKLNIKTADLENPISSLSGGNQQKVVIAKWLLVNSNVLILDEPTRGIDVGAKFEIYKIMTELVKSGISIIMISSEMPELIGMADRLYVMQKGHISAELFNDELTQERIMIHAMEGKTNEDESE